MAEKPGLLIHDEVEDEDIKLHLKPTTTQIPDPPESPPPESPPQAPRSVPQAPRSVPQAPRSVPQAPRSSPHYSPPPVDYDDSFALLANPKKTKERILENPPGIPTTTQDSIRPPSPIIQDEPWEEEENEPWEEEEYRGHRRSLSPPPRVPYIDPEEQARQMRQRKNELLGRIDYYRMKGHDITKTFNHTSDIIELESIVHRCEEAEKKKTGLEISRKLLVGFVGMVEWLNHEYDPLGAELDGWSNDINSNIGNYDSVLLRVWEKYGQGISQSNPLLELALALGISGVTYHMIHKATKEAEEKMQRQNAYYTQPPAPQTPQTPRPPPTQAPPRPQAPPPIPNIFGGGMSGMPGMTGITSMLQKGKMPSMIPKIPKKPPTPSTPPPSPPRDTPPASPPIFSIPDGEEKEEDERDIKKVVFENGTPKKGKKGKGKGNKNKGTINI